MAKVKSSYFCQNCGYNSPKWQGKCPSCQQWNTFVEEIVQKEDKKPGTWKSNSSQKANKPQHIQTISSSNYERMATHDAELDRVLGGGIVPGSLVLIGGEPGIGKSTLMLQLALKSASKVLYVSGEESETQIKMRAERIDINSDNCYILTETNTQNIFKQIEILEPELLIIDSIQTLQSVYIESAAGSISQVRECTAELMKFAKESSIPVVLIGHITKEGALAGPKVLEHMVDTVLQFEGDRHLAYRLLRTTKNRFGSTSELGIYEMQGHGLREVSNPSEILITQRDMATSGVSIAATQEGNRPLMVEIQALVSNATYGTPQRTSTGFDAKRLNMLLAVLEKRGGFRLGNQDVFLNIAGGIKVEDPAVDLAICMAIVSSYEELPIPENCCFVGEVGLGGEIRAVNRIETRVAEAEKLGFEKVFLSRYNKSALIQENKNIQVIWVSKLNDVLSELFG